MPPHNWVNNLNHESRLRARMTTDRIGQVMVFTLQLEFLVEDDWLPAIRYDSAHGEAHIDLIDPSGVQYDKIWLGQTPPYNVLFTLVEDELEADAAEHRRRFLRQVKGGQK